ncbi:MAG: DUF4197 family protein [Porticoccaceae bacterium]
MQSAVEERARQTVSRYFFRQFGTGVDKVLAALAAEDGFLGNPLVKLLLPPPVGLMVEVGQAFYSNPQAALLDTLINRAAEQVTLGAGPILKTALEDVILNNQAQALLSGGPGAITEHLRERTGEDLHKALLPSVSKALDESGAVAIYRELAEISDILSGIGQGIDDLGDVLRSDEDEDGDTRKVPAPVAADELDEYVTARTIDGIFRMIEQRELVLREQIELP